METHLRINRKPAIMFILALNSATWTQVGCHLLTLRAFRGHLGHKTCPSENCLKKIDEKYKVTRSYKSKS